MDITMIFKSIVKAKKTQWKCATSNDGGTDSLFRPPIKCKYIIKFKDLLHQITQLRDFLLKNRKAYMNISSVDFISVDEMTDFDRDKVDREAQFIIKSCQQLISNYKKEIYNIDVDTQELENRRAILDLIEVYLKNVCKIYTEQKAIRVKLTVEVQKMSKLTKNSVTTPLANGIKHDMSFNHLEGDRVHENKKSSNSENIRYSTFAAANETEENSLSDEELQMFKMENDHLYNELNSLHDEVKDIQSKVVKIAELQEVFTEKVLEQNDEIERISTTLVGTTENLKDANVQIRQAIQSNASLRIYILFFLLVMSFSLLFLDWYNE